jgi:predicted PurR-regulated permease PerM
MLIGPILLALFLSILLLPVLDWLRREGLSTALALLITIALVIAVGLALVFFVWASFESLADSLSTYQASMAEREATLRAELENRGINLSHVRWIGSEEMAALLEAVAEFLSRIGSLAANAALILGTIIFALLEAPALRERLREELGAGSPLVARMAEFGRNLVRYFALRALVNLITGGTVAVLLLVLGIDHAVLWGILTFFLSFVPYLGIVIATIPAVLLAWAEYGAGMAIAVIVGVAIINLSAENLVAPKLIGKGLHISALVVFLSFVFWSWLLGPLGMFLSMPLTVIVVFVLAGYEETQWLARVISAPPSEPAPAEGST